MTGSNGLVLISLKEQKHPNDIFLLLCYSQNESVELPGTCFFITIVTLHERKTNSPLFFSKALTIKHTQ